MCVCLFSHAILGTLAAKDDDAGVLCVCIASRRVCNCARMHAHVQLGTSKFRSFYQEKCEIAAAAFLMLAWPYTFKSARREQTW